MLTGWYVGYTIGAAVVVVVVMLVAALLSFARRIGVQVHTLTGALLEVKASTAALPGVATVNQRLGSVVDCATEARAVLAGDSA